MSRSRLVSVARAARVVDAFKRKPEGLRVVSFFGEYDVWRYIPVFDDRLCPECLGHAIREHYGGVHLRVNFPYLEIVNVDTINAKVHPNCRCRLKRVTDPLEYLTVTQGLFQP